MANKTEDEGGLVTVLFHFGFIRQKKVLDGIQFAKLLDVACELLNEKVRFRN